MESKVLQAISLKYNPVAIIWTDNKPENALQFKKGGSGCVMNMLASAAKGGLRYLIGKHSAALVEA